MPLSQNLITRRTDDNAVKSDAEAPVFKVVILKTIFCLGVTPSDSVATHQRFLYSKDEGSRLLQTSTYFYQIKRSHSPSDSELQHPCYPHPPKLLSETRNTGPNKKKIVNCLFKSTRDRCCCVFSPGECSNIGQYWLIFLFRIQEIPGSGFKKAAILFLWFASVISDIFGRQCFKIRHGPFVLPPHSSLIIFL
jgi:hypothetical protein